MQPRIGGQSWCSPDQRAKLVAGRIASRDEQHRCESHTDHGGADCEGEQSTGRSITPAPLLALPSSSSVSTDNWKRFKAATVDLLAQRTLLAVARSHGSVQIGATRSTQPVAMIAA